MQQYSYIHLLLCLFLSIDCSAMQSNVQAFIEYQNAATVLNVAHNAHCLEIIQAFNRKQLELNKTSPEYPDQLNHLVEARDILYMYRLITSRQLPLDTLVLNSML